MKRLSCFLSSMMAGLAVGMGGLAFLSVENKVVGASLFTIGLFTICSFGLDLFTGRVCYAPFNDKGYALRLPLIWLGNLLGSGIPALLAAYSRIGPGLAEKAQALCRIKTEDSLLSLFLLAVLCNMLIYVAVEGYKSIDKPLGKYLALYLGVVVFIVCGTEHCVADMFYFWMAGAWSGRAVVALLVMSLGNALGGILLALLHYHGAKKLTMENNKS